MLQLSSLLWNIRYHYHCQHYHISTLFVAIHVKDYLCYQFFIIICLSQLCLSSKHHLNITNLTNYDNPRFSHYTSYYHHLSSHSCYRCYLRYRSIPSPSALLLILVRSLHIINSNPGRKRTTVIMTFIIVVIACATAYIIMITFHSLAYCYAVNVINVIITS